MIPVFVILGCLECIGKNQYPVTTDYSVVSKLFEKLENERFVDYIEKGDFLWYPVWLHMFLFNCRTSDSGSWWNC